MVDKLFKVKSIKDWDLEINTKEIEVEGQILATPSIILQKQLVKFDPRALSREKVRYAMHLFHEEWILVVGKKN